MSNVGDNSIPSGSRTSSTSTSSATVGDAVSRGMSRGVKAEGDGKRVEGGELVSSKGRLAPSQVGERGMGDSGERKSGKGESGKGGSGKGRSGVEGEGGEGRAAEEVQESTEERVVGDVEKETGVGFWGDDGDEGKEGSLGAPALQGGGGRGNGEGKGEQEEGQRQQGKGQRQHGESTEQQRAGTKGGNRGRGGIGDDKSPPLANTREKLHQWMENWRKKTHSLLPSTFQDPSLLPTLELDSPPPLPLPLPNLGPDLPVDPARDPNLWQPFHVKGTPRMVTLFSGECTAYFDWQTLGLMYSFRRSGQPGKLVRLLACNEDMLKEYRGLDLAPTMVVPNWDHDPHNGDWYSAINKPVGVKYWLDNSPDAQAVDFVLILDADQILRRPIMPWELGAERGRPVSADYGYLIGCDNILGSLHMKRPNYLIGCDNILGSLHMKRPKYCDKVGDTSPSTSTTCACWPQDGSPRQRRCTPVRADKAHYATNITGDVYGQGWISEMYGYSFGASDANLHHVVIDNIMLYPGYPPVPNVDPRLFHYGLEVKVLEYMWDKSRFRDTPLALTCGLHFPDPPDVTDLPRYPRLVQFLLVVLAVLVLLLVLVVVVRGGLAVLSRVSWEEEGRMRRRN
ncbi:hypothetical protein CLOM_g8686 [Closterium sp. NIES-68]|nr:hypothetical protein CLOM_g8686 [Closterium sp. NIES-68]